MIDQKKPVENTTTLTVSNMSNFVLSVFIGLCVSWVLLLLLGAYR
jgi:hypothetical protein